MPIRRYKNKGNSQNPAIKAIPASKPNGQEGSSIKVCSEEGYAHYEYLTYKYIGVYKTILVRRYKHKGTVNPKIKWISTCRAQHLRG